MIKDTILYDLLCVEPTSNENQIIVAYYEQAEKYHPDNLEEKDENSILKFDEIKFAYDVLSNQLKRKFYDENGIEATKVKYEKCDEDVNYDNYTSQNYYADLVDDTNVCYQSKKYTKNLVFPLKVSLKDLYRGAQKNFDYQVSVICKTCEGTGLKKNDKPKCSKCADKKESNSKIKEICPECNSGDDQCETCKGKRVVREDKNITITIEKGMHNKQKIAFTGLSDQKPGYETGDLIFILEQSKHETFKTYQDHLIMKHTVTLSEALGGFKFLFRHLDGRLKAVTHPMGDYIHNQSVKCIPKLGMPKFNTSDFGDLFIKFDVKFPPNRSLNPEKIKLIEQILPPKLNLTIKEDENMIKVTSEHVDKDFFKQYESDDEIKYAVDENLPEEAFIIKDDINDFDVGFANQTQRIECNNQ